MRKPNRLDEYDYSRNGVYFITICTQNRHELLWDNAIVGANCVRPIMIISDNHPKLSDVGVLIAAEISRIDDIYANVKIDNFVIMPNHIHMLIRLDNIGRTTISRIIKQFKGVITKKIGYSIWQKSFHDHIVRNVDEYSAIWQYIEQNPANWQTDELYRANLCENRIG